MPERRPLSAAEDYQRGVAKTRADEAERCALLAEGLAQRWERSATKIRSEGTYYVRAIWPPFKRTKCVTPGREKAAKDIEAAAHGLRTIARGCREGWDPRTLPLGDPDRPVPPRAEQPADVVMPDGDIWGPCPHCSDPYDCGSWKTCLASGKSS